VNDPDLYQVVDTSLFANRSLVPEGSIALLDSLDARVTLSIGQDVWLRSEEANIQLSGNLAIRRTEAGRLGGQPRLALSGALEANRGTYRLNLGVVQRTFDVDRGEIRFDGSADLDPGLDISAVHTVRQPTSSSRPDVRIRVDIGGTLTNPVLRLRSDEGLPISESDLVSYLVTGQPAFALANFGGGGTGNSNTTSTVASVLLPSAGSVLANKIPAGLVDVLEVQTAGLTATDVSGQTASNAVRGIVAATRLSLGWQIGSRTFLSTNFGLCSFASVEGSDDVNLGQTIGAKIEHRFNHGISAEVSSEPETSALLCSGGAATRGFAPTNRQFGFDLFKTWQF
jgi:translocation and assembly module TamB